MPVLFLPFLLLAAAHSLSHAATPGKGLIVVYSLTNNTATVAGYVQQLTGADMARIETVTPYPDDFETVVRQARRERESNFLPPIHPLSHDVDDYDTIYLGYPIWGQTIPQPLATFLSQNNLAGKTVVPFCTHDGYGTGWSYRSIAERCPDATLLEGFDMVGAQVRDGMERVSRWLQKIASLCTGSISRQSVSGSQPIIITIGDTILTGELNDSPEGRQFAELLPQTVSMVGYGGREYYGSGQFQITPQQRGQLRFDDGDITYCPQNNTVAIFYAQTNQSNLTMRVIPMGRVTSDLSVLHTLGGSVDITFSQAR